MPRSSCWNAVATSPSPTAACHTTSATRSRNARPSWCRPRTPCVPRRHRAVLAVDRDDVVPDPHIEVERGTPPRRAQRTSSCPITRWSLPRAPPPSGRPSPASTCRRCTPCGPSPTPTACGLSSARVPGARSCSVPDSSGSRPPRRCGSAACRSILSTWPRTCCRRWTASWPSCSTTSFVPTGCAPTSAWRPSRSRPPPPGSRATTAARTTAAPCRSTCPTGRSWRVTSWCSRWASARTADWPPTPGSSWDRRERSWWTPSSAPPTRTSGPSAMPQPCATQSPASSVPCRWPDLPTGRAAGSILGAISPARRARPVLGTAALRVFGLTAAMTGASQHTLQRAGIAHHTVHVHPGHHAGYFPGAEQMHLTITFAPDGRLLGAQAVGRDGVDKRIDVLATALFAGMTVDDVAELELAYAPPYGSAKDAVNMAGFVAQNVLDGTLRLWYPEELDKVLDTALVLDVRTAREHASGHLPGALNVPHTELRARLEEVRSAAGGRPVRVHCVSGFRSYLAHRVLDQAGFDSASLSGGLLTLHAARPDVQLVRG